jgi:thioredoxin-like negative regulator of GroEL
MAFKEKMTPLLTQEEFEVLRTSPKLESAPALIYFTASWCNPCRKFDWESIKDSLTTYTVYICDVDKNTYTPGYCGVRSIPNFVVLKPGAVIGPNQISDADKLLEWLKESA